MRTLSIGFIVRMQDGTYLLGRSHGHPSPHCWTIFKGHVEKGETHLQTAIRELKEEAGIDVESDPRLMVAISEKPVYEYRMKRKDVIVYLLDDKEGILNGFAFKCVETTHNNNPHFLEIMEYKSFPLENLAGVLFPSQVGLVEKLKELK